MTTCICKLVSSKHRRWLGGLYSKLGRMKIWKAHVRGYVAKRRLEHYFSILEILLESRWLRNIKWAEWPMGRVESYAVFIWKSAHLGQSPYPSNFLNKKNRLPPRKSAEAIQLQTPKPILAMKPKFCNIMTEWMMTMTDRFLCATVCRMEIVDFLS